MIIRKATYDDLEAVHRLVGALAVYEKAADEFLATMEVYQNNWKNKVFDIIIAEKEEKVIGMALYYLTFSTWKGRMMYLEDFVVDEDYRQQGIGQLLFDAFIAESKAQDCKLVKWQVLDWNSPAVNFYEKNGATIEKEWWNGKIIF